MPSNGSLNLGSLNSSTINIYQNPTFFQNPTFYPKTQAPYLHQYPRSTQSPRSNRYNQTPSVIKIPCSTLITRSTQFPRSTKNPTFYILFYTYVLFCLRFIFGAIRTSNSKGIEENVIGIFSWLISQWAVTSCHLRLKYLLVVRKVQLCKYQIKGSTTAESFNKILYAK